MKNKILVISIIFIFLFSVNQTIVRADNKLIYGNIKLSSTLLNDVNFKVPILGEFNAKTVSLP
ncbi:MAG: hypothetical protein PHG03_00515, partial [Bacilli bacterium]|nr:hypothetical protein [Bacilli bacterium]MDD4795028.1 hypothetical protein [Bacilli bacterium]